MRAYSRTSMNENSKSTLLRKSLVMALTCVTLGMGGKYPTPLASKKDIHKAKPSTYDIDIRNLPIEDFPALSKFPRIKTIRFANIERKGANDEKLKALASI